MKTFLVSALLCGSLGLNVYLLNSYISTDGQLDDDMIEPIDEIKLAQSAVKKNNRIEQQSLKHQNKLEEIQQKFLPEKKSSSDNNASVNEKILPDHYEEEYTKQKEIWRDDISSFLEVEIGLDRRQVEDYFNLQREREKNLSDYITPKIEAQGTGTYVFNVEDNIATAKINEKYLGLLKEQLGEEGYKRYSEYKERLNKKMMDSGNTYFIMEF